VFGPDDDAFSTSRHARFVTARGGYADARVDDDDDHDDHDDGARSVHSKGTTFEFEAEEKGLTPSSSSSTSSSDDEANAVALSFGPLASAFRSARFAAPGNRHRREACSRARVGEARVAALGARGDDGKGFGALGEAGVAFAENRPAGRRKHTETKTPSFVRSTRLDTHLGDRPVAIESKLERLDASRRNRAKNSGDASLSSAFSDDDDDDVRARAGPIDDGFGLARCRGSGLRLPPPPASLPRAAEAPSLSRVIHDRRVAAVRARGAATTIREARRGLPLGEKTWR
jgi:hypothetical protein